MNSNISYDPDAMAQAEADKAQANNTTQGLNETAKYDQMLPNKYGIAIEITGEYLMQSDSSIGYKIQGYTEQGEFETIQGYLDFVRLREELVNNWTESKIPTLLPVDQYKKNQSGAIGKRRDALVKFLKGIAEVLDIYNSVCFQEFLKSGRSSSEAKTEIINQSSEVIKPVENISVMPNFTQLSEKRESLQIPQHNYSYNQEQNNYKQSYSQNNYSQNNLSYSQNNSLHNNQSYSQNNYSQNNLSSSQNNYSQNNLNYSQNNSHQKNQSYSQQNNQSQIKSVPPRNQNQNQNQNKNPSVTIIGDFQRAGSFGGMHKEYHIRGYDANGMFEVSRRYNDFMLIREILVNNWPEVKFKELPRRFRTEGENETYFQNERSKGLIDFLQSITLMPDIFHSSEWQTFIKDSSPKIADKLKFFKKTRGLFSRIFGK